MSAPAASGGPDRASAADILHPALAEATRRGEPVDIRVWRRGVMSFPFFSEEYCRFLVERALGVPEWEPVIDDWEKKTAHDRGKEIGLSRLDVLDDLVGPFNAHLLPAIRACFNVEVSKMEEPFIIRYALGGVTRMGAHRDGQGLVSGIVRLNDDYRGCRLRFPELEFDAGDVPLGHALLFPRTFLHEVTELESGERYSLAMWMEGRPASRGDDTSRETITVSPRPERMAGEKR